MMSDLERLKSGGSDREGQRRGVIAQLAQNNCGAQYTRAAAQAGPSNFLETIFGGIINPGGDGGPAGTYRTVCVRTCDGYFFPVSYSTVPDHFADDQRSCQRMCPASEAVLYSYRNPGEDITQAVSVSGRTYTELPNAFRYRREFTPGCSCRRPGQSWADALKNSDDSSTLEQGDIVVTEQTSKALSQVPQKGAWRQVAGQRRGPAAEPGDNGDDARDRHCRHPISTRARYARSDRRSSRRIESDQTNPAVIPAARSTKPQNDVQKSAAPALAVTGS
jgi:hypothetical protein